MIFLRPECEVRIANVQFESRERPNGKCLELIDCRGAELSGSTLTCHSRGTDPAPYPNRSPPPPHPTRLYPPLKRYCIVRFFTLFFIKGPFSLLVKPFRLWLRIAKIFEFEDAPTEYISSCGLSNLFFKLKQIEACMARYL
jgi:hypothetical protein